MKRSGDGDEWCRGYAAALASVYRNHRDAQAVRDAMVGDGITVEALKQARVSDYDMKVIELCMAAKRERV